MTIAEGQTVKFDGNTILHVSGTLNATGVTFTWADGQNQWYGMDFLGSGASGSRLENCVVEHASGKCGYSDAGVIYISGSSPTITGMTIRDSGAGCYGIVIRGGSPAISNSSISGVSTGIDVGNNANPVVTGSTFSGNENGACVSSDSGGTYQRNTFSGNTAYGLYYSGTSIIDATNCNWGDATGPLDNSDDRAAGGWYNPNGLGNKVSDHVNYVSWIIPADDDNDGLSNDLEAVACTRSNDADTDDDGLTDGTEDANHNGIVDAGETDPCNIDTDGDGIQDGTEMGLTSAGIGPGTDTTVFQPDMNNATTTNPLDADSDNDGLTDGQEDLNHNGRVDAGETNPNVANGKAMPWIPLLLLD